MNSSDVITQSVYLNSTSFFNYNTTKVTPSRPKADLNAARYIAIALTVLSAYILSALLYYTYKRSRKRKTSVASILCLLSAVCALLLSLNKLSELWIGVITCATYHQSATTIYGIGLGFIYTTLWTRQRKLYSDELLIHTVSKLSRIVSAFVIIGIYCLLIFVFVTFVTVIKFEKNTLPCHIIWYPLSSLLPIVVLIIATCFILQLVLFLLIVKPLVRGSSIRHAIFCSNADNDIFIMVKRLAICACACVFSTILLSIAILLDAEQVICVYWGNLMSLDLIVNTVSTVCCFADWGRRLLPMFKFSRRSTRLRGSVILEERTHSTTAKLSLSKA